jgi:hypothetical protein
MNRPLSSSPPIEGEENGMRFQATCLVLDQLYLFSTSLAITMRMTSDAPSVIMRLR